MTIRSWTLVLVVGMAVAQSSALGGTRTTAPPAFAVQIEGGTLKQYRTPTPPKGGPSRVSDDTLDATVAQLHGQEWELTLKPKENAVTTVWFPWEPDRVTTEPRLEDAVVYYPSLLGVAVRETLLLDFGWQGGDYPGQCFAPLIVVADDADARMVAATNWPPRRVSPMYSLGRIGLRYDDRLGPDAERTYRALVVHAGRSADERPWQRALDTYKTWLKGRLHAAGLDPSSPPWMRAADGWLNVQLQNMTTWDAGAVEETWARWGRKLPWVQFWGQMSGPYLRDRSDAEQTGCCLEVADLHPRYQQDLPGLARRIAGEGHVGFYARPRGAYAPLVGLDGAKTAEFTFLHDWLDRNRLAYGANAFYIDVLGHRYFGDPQRIAVLLKNEVDPATVIEYPIDVYPTAFLVSGSLGGGTWQGGPEHTRARLDRPLTRTTFPSFGRYLLDDRILFLGESNGDGRWWGPAGTYWTERQAFLLGAKFDVIHPTENGKPDGPEDRALALAIAARDGAEWWRRSPVYLDQQGLGNIPDGVDVRRYRGRDREGLLVVDNWSMGHGLRVTVDGRVVALPGDPLSIVVLPKTG